MKELIKAHCEAYPKLLARDLLKLVYQSSYGCEHLLSDVDSATERITEEHARLAAGSPRDIECIGDYCRVPLSYIDRGLSPRTLAQLFCLSAICFLCFSIIVWLTSDYKLTFNAPMPYDHSWWSSLFACLFV